MRTLGNGDAPNAKHEIPIGIWQPEMTQRHQNSANENETKSETFEPDAVKSAERANCIVLRAAAG